MTKEKIRMEVRDLHGKPLPDFSFDFDDPQRRVDHSAIARHELRMIRHDGGQLTAYSVHFFRGAEEIGSWSLNRDRSDAGLALV